MLNFTDALSIKFLLTALVNEMSRCFQNLALVLDDFQQGEDKSVPNALTYLVNYLPSHVHFVLASREYPILVPNMVILGQVFYEQGELNTARRYLADAIEMATHNRRTTRPLARQRTNVNHSP